ncbi:MAG: WD40 repeat domain-containing protein [bacterium]
MRDYHAALAALPEAAAEQKKKSEHRKQIKKYTENLIAFSRGEIPSLKVIPSVTPWTEDEIKKDSDRIVQNPTRLDRIRAFSQFVNSESHVLAKFGHIPGFCLQQAYNSARFGTVADAAESLVSAGVDQVLLLKSRCQRPEYDPHPALLRTLAGHRGLVYSVSVTPDGRRAVSASSDRTVRVWDLESGECLQ